MKLARELFFKQVKHFGNYNNYYIENKINDDYFNELVNRFEIPDVYRDSFRCYANNLLMGEEWFYDTESAWRATTEVLNAQFPFLNLVCDISDYPQEFGITSSYCGLIHSQRGGGTIYKISANAEIIYLELLDYYKMLLSRIDDRGKDYENCMCRNLFGRYFPRDGMSRLPIGLRLILYRHIKEYEYMSIINEQTLRLDMDIAI